MCILSRSSSVNAHALVVPGVAQSSTPLITERTHGVIGEGSSYAVRRGRVARGGGVPRGRGAAEPAREWTRERCRGRPARLRRRGRSRATTSRNDDAEERQRRAHDDRARRRTPRPARATASGRKAGPAARAARLVRAKKAGVAPPRARRWMADAWRKRSVDSVRRESCSRPHRQTACLKRRRDIFDSPISADAGSKSSDWTP